MMNNYGFFKIIAVSGSWSPPYVKNRSETKPSTTGQLAKLNNIGVRILVVEENIGSQQVHCSNEITPKIERETNEYKFKNNKRE